MKKFKPISLETAIALFWGGRYYGTRRGEYHRGCCDKIPLGEGRICFASDSSLSSRRCCICYGELMTYEERAILFAEVF